MKNDDDETEGFLTPARADAIAANLVDVGYVEVGYGKLKSFPLDPETFPTGVTLENWPELQAAGWQWLTNVIWPRPGSVVEGVKARYGEANVLLGLPWGDQGPVDWDGVMAGVYVLENLQLPESVRKFIAEHEEKP